MKKLFSILILALFIYQSIGYYISFSINKYNNINNNKIITVFNFSKKEFHKINWKKKNKEFIYNNNLYDIKSITNNKENIIIYCFADDKETSIYNNLGIYLSNFVTTTSENNNNLFFIFFKSSFLNSINDLIFFKTTFKNNFRNLNLKTNKIFLDILIPPPIS